MHLEGFKIKRNRINCFFNVSESSINHLIFSKVVLNALSVELNRQISDYLNFKKEHLKYKYNLRLLINHKIWRGEVTKQCAKSIIAKEIGEPIEVYRCWENILIGSKDEIPLNRQQQLSKIFNLEQIDLENK